MRGNKCVDRKEEGPGRAGSEAGGGREEDWACLLMCVRVYVCLSVYKINCLPYLSIHHLSMYLSTSIYLIIYLLPMYYLYIIYLHLSIVYLGFPGGSVIKNLPVNAEDAGDTGSIPGSGRSPGGGSGNPLQCSCLANSMDRGAWRATIHGVSKSQTWLITYTHGIYLPTNP